APPGPGERPCGPDDRRGRPAVTDRILLTGILAEGRHGVHEHERLVPQAFEGDVELGPGLRPAGSGRHPERARGSGARAGRLWASRSRWGSTSARPGRATTWTGPSTTAGSTPSSATWSRAAR